MRPDLFSLTPSTSARAALRLLVQRNLSGLPVSDRSEGRGALCVRV